MDYRQLLETLVNRLAAIEDILGDEYDLNRLRELAQADREGWAVVLPCKVGDTIYKIPSKTNYELNEISGHTENNRIYEQIVCRAEIYENGVFLLVTCDGMDSVHSAFYKENWFLTREEAEAALEGAEHEV